MKFINEYTDYSKIYKYNDKYNVSDDTYSVGDYVKLKTIPNYASDMFDGYQDLFTKIASAWPVEMNPQIQQEQEITYKFKFSNEKFIYGFKYLIRRKMTEKEIADYKLREEVNKYNL